jgi:hypothetical protein
MAHYILGVRFRHVLKRELNNAPLAAIRSMGHKVRREHLKTPRRIGKYFCTVHLRKGEIVIGSLLTDEQFYNLDEEWRDLHH